MINFKLEPENFNYLNTNYNLIAIYKYNFTDNINLIEQTIKNFNDEIIWDKMFDINEAKQRVDYGMCMVIVVYENKPFGHLWLKDYIDGKFLFNLFVVNKTDNKFYTGQEFVSNVIQKVLPYENVYCEVDDWNEKSIKLFKRLGFKIL